MRRKSEKLVAVLSLWVSCAAAASGLFDVHLHYDEDVSADLSPSQVISTLEAAGVRRAAVTGIPPEKALRLVAAAPDRIIPVLGVYRTPADKQSWTFDAGLPARVAAQLGEARWRAVGELHLFADRRHSPAFLQIVDLASEHGLPLLMHCDPAVIDSLFERRPGATVIWAHAGRYPHPPLLRDYLDRYPRLYIDLSVRDARIAPGGELDPEWETLFWEYPGRFMTGVDTYSPERWQAYGEAVLRIRHWLEQLPADISDRIVYRNAAVVFGITP